MPLGEGVRAAVAAALARQCGPLLRRAQRPRAHLAVERNDAHSSTGGIRRASADRRWISLALSGMAPIRRPAAGLGYAVGDAQRRRGRSSRPARHRAVEQSGDGATREQPAPERTAAAWRAVRQETRRRRLARSASSGPPAAFAIRPRPPPRPARPARQTPMLAARLRAPDACGARRRRRSTAASPRVLIVDARQPGNAIAAARHRPRGRRGVPSRTPRHGAGRPEYRAHAECRRSPPIGRRVAIRVSASGSARTRP